ncbi:MAG: stage III sporulation protein AD [Clostridia bacterium]|nr:stage III sporulation protein AD [Clostridia bacterium]
MEVFRIIGVGLVTALTVLIVKQVKPEIAVVLGMAGGIVMILMLVDSLTSVISSFSEILKKSGLTSGIFSTVLKIIGVGYITEFSANLCVDAGSSSIADKILLAGKIIILVISMPIISNIIEIVSGLLP